MLLAAVVAQVVPSLMRRRQEQDRTYLPHVISTVVALGLIWSGIASIGRGLFTMSVGG
jgi:ABC-type polysaccharide transport system permease subunit